MRILGIDQGIASMGYCILSVSGKEKEIIEYGQISTYPDEDDDKMCERIVCIVNLLEGIIEEFAPDRICCEKLFFNSPQQNGRNKSASIVNTNIASGLIMYCAGKNEVTFIDYPPPTVKKKITGTGKAKKEEVREYVLKMYPELIGEEKNMTEHMVDAVAIATASFLIDGDIIEENIE